MIVLLFVFACYTQKTVKIILSFKFKEISATIPAGVRTSRFLNWNCKFVDTYTFNIKQHKLGHNDSEHVAPFLSSKVVQEIIEKSKMFISDTKYEFVWPSFQIVSGRSKVACLRRKSVML